MPNFLTQSLNLNNFSLGCFSFREIIFFSNFQQTENTIQKDKSHFTEIPGARLENEIKRIKFARRRKTKIIAVLAAI